MKVLYAAYRYDPRNPDFGSGTDYQFYSAIKRSGADVMVFGPDTGRISSIESIWKWLGKRVSKKRYAKYPITQSWDVAGKLNRAVEEWKPDVVFSIYPPPLIRYKSTVPYIFRTDTTFLGMHEDWPIYGPLSFQICVAQEKQALRGASRIITQSEWSRNVIVEKYGVPPEKVRYFPNPASLPAEIIPATVDYQNEKKLEYPLRLLFVGRDWDRKGVPTAIEIVRLLNAEGIPAVLKICGLEADNRPFVKFVGSYKKSDSQQLEQYAHLYRRAHLLIHPAVFEPAGIVPSEAAAFGTPTITNDTGGLATTVKDGVSGIVLPKHSHPDLYVREIIQLFRDEERYYRLCRSSRERYEKELNWEVASVTLIHILQEVVNDRAR